MAHNISNIGLAVMLLNQSDVVSVAMKNTSLHSDKHWQQYKDLYTKENMLTPMPFTSLYIAWLVVAGLLFIPGILANGMIIFAVFKFDKLRVPMNYLISSLAVADLLMMAAMVAIVFCDVYQVPLPAHINAFLLPSFDILISSASILNLAAVSFERALAVQRPLIYENNSHAPQTFRTIRCIWAYSFLMFTLSLLRCEIVSPLYLKGFIYTAYVCSFFLPCLVILISYAFILLCTINNVKMMRSIEKAVHHSAFLNSSSVLNNNNVSKFKRQQRMRLQEFRIAMNIMVILLPFVVGWGFYFGTHVYELINEKKRSDLYEWFLAVIPCFNSSINPLIYIFFSSSLRKCCKKLLCKNRYLKRAKETAATTPVSKRLLTPERHGSQVSESRSFIVMREVGFNYQLRPEIKSV
eukprot:gene9915-10930_t